MTSCIVPHSMPWATGNYHDQEDQSKGGKKQREGKFIGASLTDRTFDQTYHTVQEGFTGAARDLHYDAIGKHDGTAVTPDRSPPLRG